MKKNLILIILLLTSLFSYSQVMNSLNQVASGIIRIPKPTYSENSEIQIIYNDSLDDSNSTQKTPGVYVNGEFLGDVNIMNVIDSRKIENIKIDKKDYNKNGVKYYGKILVEMKPDYVPKFITLKEFSSRYLKLNNNPIIFQIDENIIDKDCNKYLVDENFILKITLYKVRTSEENIEINLVKLITKTPKNIDKANTIRIRGNEIQKTVANKT